MPFEKLKKYPIYNDFPNFYFTAFMIKTVFSKRAQKIYKNIVLNKITPDIQHP